MQTTVDKLVEQNTPTATSGEEKSREAAGDLGAVEDLHCEHAGDQGTVRAGAGAARMAVVAETVHTDAGVKGVCSSGQQDPAVGRFHDLDKIGC